MRDKIERLSVVDRQALNRIYGRSYILIALMFISLAGLLVCSGLRAYMAATPYRMTVAALVIALLAAGGLSYQLRTSEARLFDKIADID